MGTDDKKPNTFLYSQATRIGTKEKVLQFYYNQKSRDDSNIFLEL